MEHRDPKMKTNESSNNDVINGNWVLKRKRKNIGPVKPNGNKKENSSDAKTLSKCNLKKENTSDGSLSRKKGNDGVSSLPHILKLKNCVLLTCGLTF